MVWRALLALYVAVATFGAFWAPDAKGFQSPALARIIFIHLPCAFLTAGLIFVGSYYAVRFLKSGNPELEAKSVACNELGFLFACLTMATGILFSQVQWGTWWQWDPRQTSFLILLLLYLAYFALRGGYADSERRATFSSAYSAALSLPAVFLIFIFPRLPHIAQASFHPSQTIQRAEFDTAYWSVVMANFVGLSFVMMWTLRLKLRASALERAIDQAYGNDQAPGGDSAAPRVVRAVRLPKQGG